VSAVGDYKYVTQDRLGSETPILADVIAMYADKAIDELWAENERLRARSYWVECPACTDSSSIRCVCGFHSDGPAFLHEEETP